MRSYNLIDAKHLVFLHKTLFLHAKNIAAALQKREADRPVHERERVDIELFKVLAGLGAPRVTFTFGKLVEVKQPPVVSRAERPLFTKPFWLPPLESPTRTERTGIVTWCKEHKLYIWGGSSSSGDPMATPPLEEICLMSGAVTVLPTPGDYGRSQASASLWSGSVYIFGGLDANNQPKNSLLAYSVQEQTWSFVWPRQSEHADASASSSAAEADSFGPSPRYGHSSVCVDGFLFIFGGYQFNSSHRSSVSNELWVCDLSSGTWTNRTDSSPSQADVLVYPRPVIEHTAVIYNKSMWVYGGRSDQNDPCALLWEYSITSNKWRSHPAASPRWLHSAVLSGQQMVVFGGTNGQEFFHDVLTFDFKTLSWRIVPTDAESPPPMTGHAAQLSSNRMYMLAGRLKDSSLSHSIYRLQVSDMSSLQLDTFSSDLALLLNNPAFSDLQVSIGSEHIYVHRAILHVRAPKFMTVFPTLRSCSVDTLLAVLHYVYTGRLPEKSDHVQLLAMAKLGAQLSMSNLVWACERSLCELLGTNNVVQIFEAMASVDLPCLAHVAREILSRRAQLVIHNDALRTTDSSSELFRIVASAILDPESDVV